VVICVERSTDDLHVVQLMPLPPIISCFIKIQSGSAFLVLAYPGCPVKAAVKWAIVVYMCRWLNLEELCKPIKQNKISTMKYSAVYLCHAGL